MGVRVCERESVEGRDMGNICGYSGKKELCVCDSVKVCDEWGERKEGEHVHVYSKSSICSPLPSHTHTHTHTHTHVSS